MLLAPLAFAAATTGVSAADLFVSPAGNDRGSGTRATPFATLQKARDAARGMPKPVTIHLAGGTYYLPETLVLGTEDSGVTWQANEGETPIVSGGVKLDLKWRTYKDGILQTAIVVCAGPVRWRRLALRSFASVTAKCNRVQPRGILLLDRVNSRMHD